MTRALPQVRRGRQKVSADGLAIDAVSGDGVVPLYDQVYAELSHALMTGTVEPDQLLSARSLASRLGTSVTPVKEALRRLRAEGVLHALPKSAFKISPMTVARFRELLDIRTRLEGLAAEEACRNASPELLKTLRCLNERYRASSNRSMAAVLAANHDFHFAIYEAADRPELLEIIRGLWLRIGPYLGLTKAFDLRASSVQHDVIIAALQAGNARSASSAVCDDLVAAGSHIVEQLRLREEAAAQIAAAPIQTSLRALRKASAPRMRARPMTRDTSRSPRRSRRSSSSA